MSRLLRVEVGHTRLCVLDGSYYRSQLMLTLLDMNAKGRRWASRSGSGSSMDYESLNIEIFATHVVGTSTPDGRSWEWPWEAKSNLDYMIRAVMTAP